MIGSIWADRYEIRALLGEGAMASVYEAFDSEENRSIALKIPRDTVLSSSELRARFEREAHAATQVDHPALVRAFGLGHTPLGIPYLIFERVSGDGLVEALSPLPVPWPRALRICAAIAGSEITA